MTDLLIAIFVTGFAVTYILELLDLSTVGAWISKTTINVMFAPPLSFGGLYILMEISRVMWVSVPATIFVSLVLGKLLNKPNVYQARLPRL